MKKSNYKSFVEFINEELETENVLDLIVKYNIEPKHIVAEAPSNYSEDIFIQYLQDLWFNELPGGPDNLDKIFGVNGEHLIDTYLEYEGFSHSKKSIHGSEVIEWDSQKDPDNKQELEYFMIKNVKYCLSFDKFELKIPPNDDIDKTIQEIFKTYESNSINKYPIEIKLADNSISFNNEN